MKILFYNWAIFYERNVGGGVGVYQKNLIDYFKKEENIKCYFLCSGDIYSPFTDRPFIKKLKNQYEGCESYALINSNVMAPAWHNYYNLRNYLDESNEDVLNIFDDFLNDIGGVDVIHLNNIEGLPLNIFKIKERYPSIKIVLSLHNYFLFCPHVNLFDNSKTEICKNFECGCQCLYCIKPSINKSHFNAKIRNYKNFVSPFLGKFKFLTTNSYKKKGIKLLNIKKDNVDNRIYEDYRRKNVNFVNKYVDVILSVSKRVKEIASNYGIVSYKNYVSYIGTKFADNERGYSYCRYNKDGFLNIVFLGYLKIEKGLDFLLDALKQIPESYAKNQCKNCC